MNRALAIASIALASSAAGAEVIVPSATREQLELVADARHALAARVHARVRVPVRDGANLRLADADSFGSGVLLGGGHALVALHAVTFPAGGDRAAAAPQIQVFAPVLGTVTARIAATDEERDLALLQLDSGAPAVDGAPLATAAPAAGDALVAMAATETGVRAVWVAAGVGDGQSFPLSGNEALDTTFWSGPVFDGRGRLTGVVLPDRSLRAVTAAVIEELVARAASDGFQ